MKKIESGDGRRSLPKYTCRYIAPPESDSPDASGRIPWETIQAMRLRDVTDGSPARLETIAKACWTEAALHFRFECEDDYVLATMERRDDPLYNEDVVEVFLDEDGGGLRYIELEISPKNTVFDAIITNDGAGNIEVDAAWNAEGLQTRTYASDDGRMIVEAVLPFTNMNRTPVHGTAWRWNVYRIDTAPDGSRHYWAWSPTGAADFHLSRRFGILEFVKQARSARCPLHAASSDE
jgi:hypothetical protein